MDKKHPMESYNVENSKTVPTKTTLELRTDGRTEATTTDLGKMCQGVKTTENVHAYTAMCMNNGCIAFWNTSIV